MSFLKDVNVLGTKIGSTTISTSKGEMVCLQCEVGGSRDRGGEMAVQPPLKYYGELGRVVVNRECGIGVTHGTWTGLGGWYGKRRECVCVDAFRTYNRNRLQSTILLTR